MRKLSLLLVSGLAIGTVFTNPYPSAPANAASDEFSEPLGIIAELAPGILDQTSEDHGVSVQAGPQLRDARASVSPSVNVPDIDGETSLISGTDFSIDYVDSPASTSGEVSILDSTVEDVSAIVQPTPSGVRVMSVIMSADALSEYSYTFDVPAGTRFTKIAPGVSALIDPDGNPRGAIEDPWAIDSAGRDLTTTFDWNDGVLTQRIDLSGDVQFPVVADPNWGYLFQFVMSPSVPQSGRAVSNMLHKCFNCKFPVAGAPRAFPEPGTDIPLRITLGAFPLLPAPVRVTDEYFFDFTGVWGWRFDALRGHFDGVGSYVTFSWLKESGQMKQLVSAFIVNDFPAALGGNLTNMLGAELNWQLLAENIRRG